MSQVSQKYVKDADGNVFSPITSSQSVYLKNGTNIEEGVLKYKILWSGNLTLKSDASGQTDTLTVQDDIANYDFIYVKRECGGVMCNARLSDTRIDVWQLAFSNYTSEFVNGFSLRIERVNATQVNVGHSAYFGIFKNNTVSTNTNYTSFPLRQIIGFKL